MAEIQAAANRNTCPHCGGDCLSAWARATLGPARSVPCRSCGKPVSVAWFPSIVLVLLVTTAAPIGATLAGSYVASLTADRWFAAFIAAGFAVMAATAWLWHRYVPLVARHSP